MYLLFPRSKTAKRRINCGILISMIVSIQITIILFFIAYLYIQKNSPHSFYDPVPSFENHIVKSENLLPPPLKVLERIGKSFRVTFKDPHITAIDLKRIAGKPQGLHEDCHFCEYPNYPRVFKFKHSQSQFADAFIETIINDDEQTYEEIIILTYIPKEIWTQRKSEYFGRFSNFHAKLLFENEVIDVEKCTMNPSYDVQYIMSFHCPIPKLQEDKIKSKCFNIQLLHNDEELLSKPLIVRHCESHEKIAQSDIAFCGMVSQDNSKFLIEWIEYHLLIGVSHFYMYIHMGWNNNHYNTEIFNLLDSYILENKLTIFPWNYSKPLYYRHDRVSPKAGDQRTAFTDCLHRYGHKYKWMGFLDDDEFIVPRKESLKEILKKYEKDDVHTILFNSYLHSNKRIVKSELLVEVYPELDEILPIYRKAIVKPNKCLHFDNHECGLLRNGEGKPGWWEINDFLYKSKKINGIRMLDDRKEAFISHFFYKKYHDYNPILFELSNSWKYFFTPIKVFLSDLKERVEQRKEKMDWKKYGFKFDVIKDPVEDGVTFKVPVYSKYKRLFGIIDRV